MDAEEKNFGNRALTLLREGPFRRYIIGSAISDTGTWMQVMAQGWVMSALTNQALMLGMVNFAAGIFVARWVTASAFFCNAASFIALIIALISLPARPRGTAEEEEQRRSGFKEGLRFVRSDRTILSMIALIALTTIFVFPLISVMMPLYVRNELHLGAHEFGR